MTTKYLTSRQAASILGLAPSYVSDLICRGKLPGHKANVDKRLQWVVRDDIVHRFKKQREAQTEPVKPEAIPGFAEERERTAPIDFKQWYANGGYLG